MAEAGFEPYEGGVGDGFIRFRQMYSAGFLNTGMRWRRVWVVAADGTISVTNTGEPEAEQAARTVFSQCASSS